MDENSAFLARLQQIAGQKCPREERAAQVLDLLHAYTTRLYARLKIGASNPLTMHTKSRADRTLADLRSKVLTAEIKAIQPATAVFTAARHRIDTARRVLAMRAVKEDGTASPKQ